MFIILVAHMHTQKNMATNQQAVLEQLLPPRQRRLQSAAGSAKQQMPCSNMVQRFLVPPLSRVVPAPRVLTAAALLCSRDCVRRNQRPAHSGATTQQQIPQSHDS